MKHLFLMASVLWALFSVAQSTKEDALNAIFQSLENKGKAWGSIAIWQGGKPAYQKSFGYACIEPPVKADSVTRYRTGSVSKTFTAVVILQMVEEGKLRLDDKLSRFYPGWPEADRITMEDLLRHRSGIHNFGEDRSERYRNVNPATTEDIEEIFKTAETDFEPGSRSEYNNANYVVLSLIAERVDGDSFAQILNRRIVKPLKLAHTGYGKETNPMQNEAYSYYKKRGRWMRNSQADLTTLKGAGAVVSTPTELCKFYRGLFQGMLLSADLLEKMKPRENAYGMGLFTYPFYDKECHGHAGSVDAFECFAAYFPSEDVAIAICLNAGGDSMNDILKKTLEMWFEAER